MPLQPGQRSLGSMGECPSACCPRLPSLAGAVVGLSRLCSSQQRAQNYSAIVSTTLFRFKCMYRCIFGARCNQVQHFAYHDSYCWQCLQLHTHRMTSKTIVLADRLGPRLAISSRTSRSMVLPGSALRHFNLWNIFKYLTASADSVQNSKLR